MGGIAANAGTVLLLRRADDEFMSGLVELPSGWVVGGETLEEALVREMEEETGRLCRKVNGASGDGNAADREEAGNTVTGA